MKRRDEIDKRYLVTIAHYGKVILHTNRADFDKEAPSLIRQEGESCVAANLKL